MDDSIVRSGRLSAVRLAALALVAGAVLPAVRDLSAQEVPPRAAKEPGAGKMTLSGRVIDPDGRPVSKARLLLTDAMDARHRLLRWRSVGTSGADGSFAVSFDPDGLDIPVRNLDLGIATAATVPPEGHPLTQVHNRRIP